MLRNGGLVMLELVMSPPWIGNPQHLWNLLASCHPRSLKHKYCDSLLDSTPDNFNQIPLLFESTIGNRPSCSHRPPSDSKRLTPTRLVRPSLTGRHQDAVTTASAGTSPVPRPRGCLPSPRTPARPSEPQFF